MKAFELAFNFHAGRSKRQGVKTQDDIWDRCRMGGAPPYIGLDEAVLLSTALYHVTCDEAHDDVIVNEVMKYAIEVKARDEGLGDWRWSEARQREFIEDKLVRFKEKWKRQKVLLRKKRREEMKAAKEQARDTTGQDH
jgi:hypothetical protein